jgi:hypothetical protein
MAIPGKFTFSSVLYLSTRSTQNCVLRCDPNHTQTRAAWALQHADVLTTPAADVLCTGIGGNALNFELRVWSAKQAHTPSILRSDLYFEILLAFHEHGIKLPPGA